MNIGFVSTWFERGAAYVTKAYIELLKEEHSVFVYARGGETTGKGDKNWDFDYVTWAPRLYMTNIRYSHIKKWITNNNLDIIFFNEQTSVSIVYKIKRNFPHIKIGAYIDYYKENTVKEFDIYDFLICNTKRHYSVFKHHSQAYFVPWGTDIDTFTPQVNKEKDSLVFFHSAGMSNRKGTTYVIESFIDSGVYKNAQLVIHIQRDFEEYFDYKVSELKEKNIIIIEKNVSAPGLYHLGDVYVYPTTLDGLGLTMYEALACGLPVITTDNPPMNEVIDNEVGKLVEVDYFRSRSDGYYWPLSIVKKESLNSAFEYYVENQSQLRIFQKKARDAAVRKWNWKDRKNIINDIFTNSIIKSETSFKEIPPKKVDEIIKDRIGTSYLYSFVKLLKSKF